MSKETILKQIDELKKQLKELEDIEISNGFIKLLIEILFDGKCSIILQGYEEWQFQVKYLMKDIKFEHRQAITKALQEIIKEYENE